MNPVDQQHKHDPESGSYGDCFRACVASLLCLPIEDVPHFCNGPASANGEWFRHLTRWANTRGLFVVYYEGLPDGWAEANGYGIVGGKSPRGDWQHAVIFRGSVLAHDPHPSRDGIDGDPADLILLAPMDWATIREATLNQTNPVLHLTDIESEN